VIASFMAAVVSAVPAAHGVSNPLVGIWKSDEARTQREIQRRGSKLEPGSFGRTAYAFTETRAIIADDGECERPFSYRYQRVENRRVRVLVFQPRTENFILELELARNELRIPIGGELNDRSDDLLEVFRRSSPEDVAPCIKEWLAKREPEDEAPAESVRLSGPAEAADLAARLANDECEKEYGDRPFAANNWPIVLERGRWLWGRIHAFGPQGYSAVVSFERNGGLPLVRIYALAHDVPDRTIPQSSERPDGGRQRRRTPNDHFWKHNDKLVPP
jgi:hypothetical protein